MGQNNCPSLWFTGRNGVPWDKTIVLVTGLLGAMVCHGTKQLSQSLVYWAQWCAMGQNNCPSLWFTGCNGVPWDKTIVLVSGLLGAMVCHGTKQLS